ncbi:hypothetical protein GCM10023166_01170 [Paeniglutamicibacter cryotolerans]
MALCSGLWAAGLLAFDGHGHLYLAAGWAAVALLHRRTPLVSAVGASLLLGAGALLGIPTASAAPMIPVLIIAFGCGRNLRHRFAVCALAPLLATLSIPQLGATAADAFFAALLYLAAFGFGRLVRRRADGARSAWAGTRALMQRDRASTPCPWPVPGSRRCSGGSSPISKLQSP